MDIVFYRNNHKLIVLNNSPQVWSIAYQPFKDIFMSIFFYIYVGIVASHITTVY